MNITETLKKWGERTHEIEAQKAAARKYLTNPANAPFQPLQGFGGKSPFEVTYDAAFGECVNGQDWQYSSLEALEDLQILLSQNPTEPSSPEALHLWQKSKHLVAHSLPNLLT